MKHFIYSFGFLLPFDASYRPAITIQVKFCHNSISGKYVYRKFKATKKQ